MDTLQVLIVVGLIALLLYVYTHSNKATFLSNDQLIGKTKINRMAKKDIQYMDSDTVYTSDVHDTEMHNIVTESFNIRKPPKTLSVGKSAFLMTERSSKH
jgi:hypothetical protein